MLKRMIDGFMALTIFMTLIASSPALGQQQDGSQAPRGPRDMARMGDRAFGTVASVGVDRFELKKMDGTSQTIMVDDQTHFREGPRDAQKDIALEDLKPGDRVIAFGHTNDDKQFVATNVHRMTEEEISRFQNAGDRAFGEIVSIDGSTIKVRNPFQGEQTVVVSDKTTFMKDGQPMTLKDLKAGDRIAAMGKLADGKLSAERVFTGQFRRGGRMQRGGGMPPENQ